MERAAGSGDGGQAGEHDRQALARDVQQRRVGPHGVVRRPVTLRVGEVVAQRVELVGDVPGDPEVLDEPAADVGPPHAEPDLLQREGVAAGTAADLQHPGLGADEVDEVVDVVGHLVGHRAGAGGVLLGVRVVGVDRDPLGQRRHVVQVVLDVVEVVAAERGDVEHAAVAADALAAPVVVRDGRVDVAHGVRRGHQRGPDDRGHLLVVAPLDGGRVLVPVRELRLVLGHHRREPLVEDLVHVVDVAGVLQGRPDAGCRTDGDLRVTHEREPHDGVGADPVGQVGDADGRGVVPALGARPLEDPGPVLGVGRDRPGARHGGILSGVLAG